VAKAFRVPINGDPRALAILHEWVKTTGAEMNEARLRMMRIPQGRGSHPQQGVRSAWLLDR
jgi:molybdopterin-biosynthesis enzyme MoeA-like protein